MRLMRMCAALLAPQVVGKAPGATKVSQASAKGIQMLDIAGLKAVLETPGGSLADAPAATIGAFSKGYRGNGVSGRLMGAEAPPAAPAIKAPKATKAKAAKRKVKAEEAEEEEEEEEVPAKAPKKKAAAKKKAAPKRLKRGE